MKPSPLPYDLPMSDQCLIIIPTKTSIFLTFSGSIEIEHQLERIKESFRDLAFKNLYFFLFSNNLIFFVNLLKNFTFKLTLVSQLAKLLFVKNFMASHFYHKVSMPKNCTRLKKVRHFNDNHRAKVCFTQFSTRNYFSRNLIASDLFQMFAQLIKFCRILKSTDSCKR